MSSECPATAAAAASSSSQEPTPRTRRHVANATAASMGVPQHAIGARCGGCGICDNCRRVAANRGPMLPAPEAEAEAEAEKRRTPPGAKIRAWGTNVPRELLAKIESTVSAIIAYVERTGGVGPGGPEYERLENILKKIDGPTVGSQKAYGLGGMALAGEGHLTTVQGPQGFHESVSKCENVGKVVYLGARPEYLHDELFHIQEHPSLHALASTQPHCIFCYGTIGLRNYEHGSVRQTVLWPNHWVHDWGQFMLTKHTIQTEIQHQGHAELEITTSLDPSSKRYYVTTMAPGAEPPFFDDLGEDLV